MRWHGPHILRKPSCRTLKTYTDPVLGSVVFSTAAMRCDNVVFVPTGHPLRIVPL